MGGRFSPRERRVVFIAAVVIGSWVVIAWVVEPLWQRAKQLEQQVAAQALKLEKLSDLLAKRDSIEQAYQAVSGYLADEGEGQGPAILLGELEALARRANVQINLKPRPIKRRGEVSRLGVELDLQATQAQLFSFLDALLGMPKLIELVRLNISSAPGKQDVLRAHLVLEQLILH